LINFIEYIPKNPVARTFVECYRLLLIDQAVRLTTIPNGRVDGWILLKGGFEVFDKVVSTVEEGYYDLPHFIRECKRITGQTPRELFPKMGLSPTDVIINTATTIL
jgi:hypothetical protein